MGGLFSQCVYVESMSLLLNGSNFGSFNLERKIQQGDLRHCFSSSFTHSISRMLLKLEVEGKIQRIKIGKLGPSISHLFLPMMC